LEGLDVRTNDTAEDKIKEECCPGKPFIVYRTEVGEALAERMGINRWLIEIIDVYIC